MRLQKESCQAAGQVVVDDDQREMRRPQQPMLKCGGRGVLIWMSALADATNKIPTVQRRHLYF